MRSIWQEWRAATVPTNAASALRLLSPTRDLSGLMVTWQSVTNRAYSVQRTTDLRQPPTFFTLTNNLPGQPGTTSFTDSNATGPGPFFYRVGIQE
jgi:hypothetical protein